MLVAAALLQAKEPATYHIGDAAAENIVTPVALDVIEPAATAALKSDEAMRTPSVFRFYPDATNTLAKAFLAEFAGARSNFISTVQDTFHQPTLGDAMIASPDFGYLTTAFNIQNRNFPITTDLAATWARGNPGLAEQNRLLKLLLLTMQHPVRPDVLPEGFVTGETLRLVPVSNPDEKVTLVDAEMHGKLIAASDLTTRSQLCVIFRREFTADDEQPLARALTTLFAPNCIPDARLTQLARDHAVRQLVVAEHYDAGQLIVRQGAVIDSKIKLVLDQLNEKLAGLPGPPVVAAREAVSREPQPTLPASHPAQDDVSRIQKPTGLVQSQELKVQAHHNWLAVVLAPVSLVALLILWRWGARRRRGSLLPVRTTSLPPQNPVILQADLAQAVKAALVQELAVQRRELMVTQQIAAAEISGLVQRLDELQMTMQERVQAYELQIRKLETEIAARTEENHELLKLKIEMLRQRLEVEHAHNRVEFN